MGVFYAGYGMIILRDPEWFQGAIIVLVGILIRVGLVANVAKCKTMTFQIGVILIEISEEDFSQRIKG